ncbi:hypothetical protein BDV95DRAFT_600937 [Massariosphaeria phaeospora]|uniref:Uncharacterized protein n=1 Tax=Massariosphaeria phaeospora TaxID=100035 RepID=A0A7C8IIU7_9PLEO|nr:hypothetical protein BDV95DRAFT_600937 [Massariosphaeria phaeospora]
MAAASGTTGSGEPDMALMGELLEEISRNPPAVGARKLLVAHYIAIGWLDAAMENVKELQMAAPIDQDVTEFLIILEQRPKAPTTTNQPNLAAPGFKKKPAHPPVKLPGNLDATREDLSQGYQTLRKKAKHLFKDLLHLQALQKKEKLPQSGNLAHVQAIAEGQNPLSADASIRTAAPRSARLVAQAIQAESQYEKVLDLAIVDLEHLMRWVRKPRGVSSGADEDTVRDALVKRVRSVETALPDDLKIYCELALMHVEHEHLKRNYVNNHTMLLMEDIKDIPRTHFYVTEDNYAWDITELAQAISANGGVMRNPLSREMFTPKDVRGIVMHPEASHLGALQVEQHKMSKGVRLQTIEEMEVLAKVLLEDQSSDTIESRRAVDKFMAYIATLPDPEQRAIDRLRCPARDSHTGQSYDFAIGEAVRDAKGNRVCFHKTGDFIQQAAAYLRENHGAPADPDRGCTMM